MSPTWPRLSTSPSDPITADARRRQPTVDAAFARAPEHPRAASWLEERLNGEQRIGLPRQSLVGFVRLATNPRVSPRPLDPAEACSFVEDWLSARVAWIPVPIDQHALVLGRLVETHRLSGKLVPDGHLVALAIEHGLDVCSAGTDFARFTEIRWVNPLSA